MKSIGIIVLILGFAVGCSTPEITPLPQKSVENSELLSFIRINNTTRTEVIERLGHPYSIYENQRILVYMITTNSDKMSVCDCVDQYGYKLEPNSIPDHSSLVLIFNEDGVIDKYNLVGSR